MELPGLGSSLDLDSLRSVSCDDEADSYTTATDDLVFQDIRDRLELGDRRDSLSTLASQDSSSSEAFGTRTSEEYTLVPYGLQPRATYEHGKKNTDIIGITYNGRMRRFVILDAKGITTWQKDVIDQKVSRAMLYPKYEYRLITSVVYAKKHNVYFTLGKDFSLKVLNRDFEETCRVNSDLRSILFLIFNPLRDELITGGVGGTKVWKYHQTAEKTWTEIKPMANYRLTLKHELPNVGGSWVKKVDLDLELQHLYCCSDTDLYAYDMDGKDLFRFERAHNMSITGCAFSKDTRLLVTASVDSEVKAWSLGGGLIHTFRGHSRAVTSLLLHPETSSLVLTCSLDGSVRIWSLNTMEPLYSLVVSTEGVMWMGLTDDKMLFLGTTRNITVWSLNRTATFWAPVRSRLAASRLVGGHQKSHRVITVGDDNSVRVFCRNSRKNLSTILPPPVLSPLERIRDVTYNRLVNVGYLLVNTKEIWLYTTRTDPACRVTVWDTLQIQEQIIEEEQSLTASELTSSGKKLSSAPTTKRTPSHRATERGQGNEVVCDCCSVCYMNAHAMMWNEEGICTPIQDNYLLMGLEDGRVLFMDPVVKGKKYFQFRANKDAIVALAHDSQHQCLWTQCNLGDAALVQIWTLPELELEYEVYCPADVVGYIRLGYSFVTAHSSGCLIHHTLQQYDEVAASTYRPRFGQSDNDTESSFATFTKADHGGPITAIDACHRLKIFCSASTDGVVKVWESQKVLLTEIVLDPSLTTAMFLNNQGDLLVGFKNHLFRVDRSKVCPSLEVEEEAKSDYAESEVYEDPAVLYEGVTENPDPVNLANYLVPFDLDFSQDFLEGKKLLRLSKEENPEEADDDLTSELSAAPTTVYMSPSATPRNLSLLDLTLDNQVSKHDLLANMEKLSQKHALLQQNNNLTFYDLEDDLAADAEVMRAFQMPQFGVSPGPSPTPSPPSTIPTPSDFDVSEDGECTVEESDEEVDKQSLKSTPAPPSQKEAATVPVPTDPSPENSREPEAPKPSTAQQTELATSSGSRLDNIKIDAKSLMKESNLKKVPKEKIKVEADHVHIRKPMETRSVDKTKTSRNVKKKEITRERKRPRAQKREAKSKQGTTGGDTRGESSSPRAAPSKSSTRPSARSQPSGNNKVKQKDTKEIPVESSDLTDNLLVSQVSMTTDSQGGRVPSLIQHKVGFHDNLPNQSDSKNKVARFPVGQDVLRSPSGSRSHTPSLVLHPDWTDQNTEQQTSDWVSQSLDPDSSYPLGQTEAGSSSVTDRRRSLLTPDGRSVNDLSKSPYDRGSSPAVTIISDYGSEWTIPAPDDTHFIRITEGGFRESSDAQQERKTQSAHISRHRYSQEKDSKPLRPHTAFVLPSDKQELERKFKNALAQFQNLSEIPPGSELWYKNDGKLYDSDKMIERHQLLQMQKHLRAKSAQERRLAIEKQKHERNEGILEHSASSMAKLKSRSESALGARDRPDTAATLWRPSTLSGHRHPADRPTTAATVAGGYCTNHSTRRSDQVSSMDSQSSQAIKRPATSGGATTGREGRETLLPDKSLLSAELPYRGRIRPQRQNSTHKPSMSVVEKVNIKLLDPRNPSAQKLHSSKSIPSKCTRYVFIDQTRDTSGKIVPTPLEEQLILERFPEKQDDWLTGFPRSPRMCHGIPSLDLRNLVFDSKGHIQPQYTSLTGPV